MNDAASRKSSVMKKLIAPLLILALSAAIFVALVSNQPTLKTTVKEPVPVAVRALEINTGPMQLSVNSEGNVQPSVEDKIGGSGSR